MNIVNNKKKKIFSIVIVICLLLTMLPVFTISSSAAEPTPATANSGEWTHKADSGYDDGRGINYISMWARNTNFTYMQTSDNQKFNFIFEFDAVKNDGVNRATLKGFSFDGLNMSNGTWKTLTSDLADDDPTIQNLHGNLGSGYEKQLANKLCKWNYTSTFIGKGRASYEYVMNVMYESGPTKYDVNNHSLSADNEEVVFKIDIVDMRELLSELASAKELLNNENTLTQQQTAALNNAIKHVEDNYTLDGSVVYTQNEIDALTELITDMSFADFTRYLSAIDKAEAILNNEKYPQSMKMTISELLTKKDYILSLDVSQQDEVDAATRELLQAIIGLSEPVNELNGIDNENPSEEVEYVINPVFNGCDTSKDVIYLSLSKNKIYLDKSENINDVGMILKYSSKYGSGTSLYNYTQFLSGPFSTDCLGINKKQICGQDSQANFDNYFSNYGVIDSTTKDSLAKITKNAESNISFTLDGTPTTTTGDGTTIYIGTYARFHRDSGLLSSEQNFYTSDSSSFTLASNVPSFTLYVYDKAPLKEAIENAKTIYNDATNFNEFLELINDANIIYGTRAVTETQVEEITNALNNFVFTYKVTYKSSDTSMGSVSSSLMSGFSKGLDVYTSGSVIKYTAIPKSDYELANWDNGETAPELLYTVNGGHEIIATFKFVSANYDDLTNMLANIPNDVSVYSDDSVLTLNAAIINAQNVINANYGKSNQSIVDNATEVLENALSSLEKVVFAPCDYFLLDKAIDSTHTIIKNNDGRYLDEAWKNYQNALAIATEFDRTLTDEDPDNQNKIVNAAVTLADSINALNNTINQNQLCDYSLLNSAIENSENIMENNNGKFTEEDWKNYQAALKTANEISDTMYDDDSGINQKNINDAAAALRYAINTLTNNAYNQINVYNKDNELINTIFVSDITGRYFNDNIQETIIDGYNFIGWGDNDGKLFSSDDKINSDTNIYPVYELSLITPKETSNLKINRINNYIIGLNQLSNTVADIKTELKNDSVTISVYDTNNVKIQNDELIGTGYKIVYTSKLTGKELDNITVILLGDIDCNGLINESDRDIALNETICMTSTNGIQRLAADVNCDSVVDGFDVAKIDLNVNNKVLLSQTVLF